MKQILKYHIDITDTQRLSIPRRGKILSIGPDRTSDVLQVWVEFNKVDIDSNSRQTWTIHIVGTGQSFEPNERWQYIDTVSAGSFVWHVFRELSA